MNASTSDKIKVVKTDEGAKDGQNKCPSCGATDISVNTKTGMLRCNFCRHEFKPQKIEGMETDITKLEGEIFGSGTQDIAQDASNLITLKCSSCGAEVVIDTEEQMGARCHWCRNTLSVNNQIPNGAIPDVVLPFKLSKADAKKEIEKFVLKRQFFAHPKFKEEFTTENIMGVYFPYMIVDVNSHVSLKGTGEHQTRRYIKGSGSNSRTYYDADLYEVEREFDLTIDGLTVESSSDKLNKQSNNKTNNVINAIMPFDIENSAKWDANYLKGYTSERRDTNIDDLRKIVDNQSKDIARHSANKTLEDYDRGVCWQTEDMKVKGKQWKSAYLPVWLYSYQEKRNEQSILHYVAVNARTKETMGSVPLHMPKLFGISALIELIGIFLMIMVDFKYRWIFLLSGILYFFLMHSKYRNREARHKYETETKTDIYNLRKLDVFIKHQKGLSNSKMIGANNKNVSEQSANEVIMNALGNFKY